MSRQKLNIVNRKARHEYELGKTFVAGLILTGSEIKSLRLNNANINNSYCYFRGDELFVKDMHIAEYEQSFIGEQHVPNRDRKLLLNKEEIKTIKKKLETKGFTIVSTRIFLSSKGWAKLEIALAKGKKLVDKRNALKERDIDRESQRKIKE